MSYELRRPLRGAQIVLHAFYPLTATSPKRLLLVYHLPKTLPHDRSSHCTTPLGNYTYILAFGVAEGTLVR